MAGTTTRWLGSSLAEYEFDKLIDLNSPAAELHDCLNLLEGKGNYIFAKRALSRIQAVKIGQGDLRDRFKAAIDEGCVLEKGATLFLYHANPIEHARLTEEADLIEGNRECLEPTGCNKIMA